MNAHSASPAEKELPIIPFDRLELVEAGGAVHLGIPLVERLSESLGLPGLVVQPAVLSAEECDTLRKGDRKVLFREWLAPMALQEAADRIGLPIGSLSVILAHGAEDITVMGVEGNRMADGKVTILDMDAIDKSKLDKEATRNVAAPIVSEIEKAAAEKKGRIQAVILTGELAREGALSRSLKKAVQGLAPVLSFDGRPDARSAALAAQEALAYVQAKSIPGRTEK